MNLSRGLSTLLLLAFVLTGRGNSAESGKATPSDPPSGTGKAAAKAPLAGLPSAAGAHLEKIKALGDGQWLNIGSPAPDPKWGKARGRSWAQMSYAPDLRAAFLYGEGRHGYVKPDGFYQDDLWAYDLNGNRWICLYPGTDTNSVSLKMDANGFEVDDTGQPIPVAMAGHGFNMMTYDTDQQKFMFVPSAIGNFNATPIGPKRKAWGGFVNWPYTPQNCSPWMYNTASGKFELLKVKGAFPGGHVEAGAVAYSPGSKKLFYSKGGNDGWLYDAQANAWSAVPPKGPRPPFGIDASVCMDTKRDRVYIAGGYYPFVPKGSNAFWCFDMKTSTWIDLQPKGAPCKGCNRYGNNHAVMTYDSVNDTVVLIYHLLPVPDSPDGDFNPGPEALGVYVYDVAANSWSEKIQSLPKEITFGAFNGFYSPELNAHFIHLAGDSEDNGVIWVYRYKQAKK